MITLRLIERQIKRFKDTGLKQTLFLFKLKHGQVVAIPVIISIIKVIAYYVRKKHV